MLPAGSVLIALLLLACGSSIPPPPSPAVPTTDHPAAKPKKRVSRLVEQIIDKSFDYQIRQVLDLPRMGRKLIGRPYEALNVNNFDELPNSAWFTNRNGVTPMSSEAVFRGPNRSSGPDPSAPWEVVSIKSAGVTPGMTILDARGDRYIIKFDPPQIFPSWPAPPKWSPHACCMPQVTTFQKTTSLTWKSGSSS
jgi:hypothetical protein